ncbi:MAG: hypothetical protein L0213_09110, partial [Candidatus Dadabacteria bacterium]|nr:hypothetical protein [Candidatus Dadabacteria bacterium]
LYNLLLKMDPENASLLHLTTVFKGSNKHSLFEILGIEEDITAVSAAGDTAKPVEEKTEIEEAQELLKQAGIKPEAEQALLSEQAEGTEVSLQEAAEIIDESSLDEILSPESGVVDAGDLAAKDLLEPEPAAEPVAEAEAVPEVESIVEEEQEKEIEAPTVSIEPPKQADISLEEEELPAGVDITERMSSMFGEETAYKDEGTIEIAVPDDAAPFSESGKKPEAVLEEKTVDTQPPQEPVEEALSGISARMEDMFGDGEISEVSAPTEMPDLEPAGETAAGDEGEAAATVIIDKEDLERISGLDGGVDTEVEEDIPAAEISDADVLGISEEAAALVDELNEEEPVSALPTELIDIERKKTEIIERTPEIENVMESVNLEDPERAVVNFQKHDELMDSMLTEATSAFD